MRKPENNKSRIVPHDDPTSLRLCADHLKNGNLVSFPTETVYGLGANALDEKAVLSIFKAKGRPLTDPVIVHVLRLEDALKLADFEVADTPSSQLLRDVFLHLSNEFWPGPLTIVVRASASVPECVTAGTGYVGIRSPNHPIARLLLQESQLPIAAPSANRFGHVSPTKAEHVMEDLGHVDEFEILVLDGGDDVCEVGIESTVMKIDLDTDSDVVRITVLRRGGVSIEQLQHSVKLLVQSRQIDEKKIVVCATQSVRKVKNDTIHGQQAPGQMITHYAPDVPAYIYTSSSSSVESTFDEREAMHNVVVVDFGGDLLWSRPSVKHYIDLSPEGDINQAASRIFDVLRQCEKVAGARAILLPNIAQVELEHADALFDRIFRAASGRFALITPDHKEIVFSSQIVADQDDDAPNGIGDE